MATKYAKSTQSSSSDPGWRRPPFQRMTRKRPVPYQRRLLVIYAGLAIAVALMFIWTGMTESIQMMNQPSQRGEGLVIGREERPGDERGPHWLHIQVTLPDGKQPAAWAPVDAEAWETFHTGTRIGVVYQASRDGARLRILQTGLFALESPLR